MKELTRTFFFAIITIWAVHFIAFCLISYLPDSSVIALGIFSANNSAADAFRTSLELRSYSQIFCDLLRFNFGSTLDNVPVITEILNSSYKTLPRMIVAFGLVFLAITFSALFTKADNRETKFEKLSMFGIFLPSFFLPLFIFSLFIISGLISYSQGISFSLWIGSTLAISITPLFLGYLQSKRVMRILLQKPFALQYRSYGFPEHYVRLKLLRNLIDEISPTSEKLLTAMLTQIILAESIFNINGIGSLSVRAVKRSDVNLILGIVLFFSAFIALLRISAIIIRLSNRGWR